MTLQQAETPDGDPTQRQKMAIEMARRYYIDDVSTPELAKEMGVSRSTISRLITMARDQGWVRIQVVEPANLVNPNSQWLSEEFNLSEVVGVPNRGDGVSPDSVPRRATLVVNEIVKDDHSVGIAWGNTTAAIAREITPRALQRCRVVQLNGAGNLKDFELDYAFDILGHFATAWQASAVVFPVPAFFDYASTREALWRERTIDRVRTIQANCDVALFSVGSITADVPSRVHLGGYLNDEDRQQLTEDGAIGDIATHFFTANGSSEGIRLNARASGMAPEDLRQIPTRVCVAQGVGKADALLGALRGGHVTHLVADQALIDHVVELAERDGQSNQVPGSTSPLSQS